MNHPTQYPPRYPNRPPIPPEVRLAVLDRADRCCEDCSARVHLEMHHLTYDASEVSKLDYAHWLRGGGPQEIFGHETPEVLAALCRLCHLQRHLDPNGDFWVDPQEMEEHWESYHRGMDEDGPWND